jgi:hypothetical protein
MSGLVQRWQLIGHAQTGSTLRPSNLNLAPGKHRFGLTLSLE